MGAAPSVKILGIAGSLRKASFNRAALRAAQRLVPPGATLEIAEIGDLPPLPNSSSASGAPTRSCS